MSAADIRECADNLEFSLYQAVSSVRIYPTKADTKFDEMHGFEKDNENTDILLYKEYFKEMGLPFPSPYPEEFQHGVFEGKPYNAQTESVYGRILVLQDWELKNEYKTNAIIKVLFSSMMKGFYSLGQDWIIFNPNVAENYMKEMNYLYHTKKSYENFLEKQGFIKTYGRLHDGDYCYCYHIQNRLDKPTLSFFTN
ncbi:hypothetical protein [Bacillus massiliigorillae]|uniref:hypothetical protein n=1 Tax=Bacillus massiliigorillae TaxID=1243664 RepID=UPI00039DCA28|nr:hypothetical protein [Bacillus massiliigorillae]